MKKIFLLEGLECADCSAKIERETAKLDGVKNVSVSFITSKMILEIQDDNLEEIVKKIKKIIKKYEPDVKLKEM